MPLPFIRIGPEQPHLPVILSVPHAGQDYSPALLASARVGRPVLETLEDRLVDRLIWRATAAGATAFVARAPRAEIDLNRDELEIDADLIDPPLSTAALRPTARSRGGLGLIPSRLSGHGALWLRRVPLPEYRRRIDEIHAPYHQALEGALRSARERFGGAILLDCHSMPPRTPQDRVQAGVILGDRHGGTMSRPLIETAMDTVRAFGLEPSRNEPFAGGYIVSRHSRPARNMHALQVEIDRGLYLDADLQGPGAGFDHASRLLEALVGALAARLNGPELAVAAE